MALDRQLSRDFWLNEFSGWENLSELEVAQARELVARVLQPVRSVFGVPVYVTSYGTWSDGTPRTGAHAHGAVDFVVANGFTRQAFEWLAQNVVPTGYVGRLIYEPQRSESEGQPQGEHIHLAPREAMVALNGDASIQVLEERAEGEYIMARIAAGLGASVAVLAGVFFSTGATAIRRCIMVLRRRCELQPHIAGFRGAPGLSRPTVSHRPRDRFGGAPDSKRPPGGNRGAVLVGS